MTQIHQRIAQLSSSRFLHFASLGATTLLITIGVVSYWNKLPHNHSSELEQGSIFREIPLNIAPEKDLKGLIGKDDLLDVLILTEPRWKMPKINGMLHALRLWGRNAEFGDDALNPYPTGTPSGEQMLSILLNTDVAEKAHVEPTPIFFATHDGIGVVYNQSSGGVAHEDQLLKVMGEISISRRTKITLNNQKTGTIEDLLKYSTEHYDPNQELEFTALAYSRWLPPKNSWKDRNNRVHDFDEMCNILLARTSKDTSCYRVHTLQALMMVYVANKSFAIISNQTKRLIESHFSQVVQQLDRNQNEDGLWLGQWYKTSDPSPKDNASFQAILATGHHLEWIAYAPKPLRPSSTAITKAARSLANLIKNHNVVTVSNGYNAFSHAAHALSLLENEDPGLFIRNYVETHTTGNK